MATLDLSSLTRLALEVWTFEYTLESDKANVSPTSWFLPFLSHLPSLRTLTVSTLLSVSGCNYFELLGHIDRSVLACLQTLELIGRDFTSKMIQNLEHCFGTMLRLHVCEDVRGGYPISWMPFLRTQSSEAFLTFKSANFLETVVTGEAISAFQDALHEEEVRAVLETGHSEESFDDDDDNTT
jgi:hypothetical protein